MLSAETLAAQYIRTKGTRPTTDEYCAFSEWVNLRFRRIQDRVDFTEQEVSPELMQTHWDLWARLLVSTAHNEHPFWLPYLNARFRAIHDWDHIKGGFGFDLSGELCAAGYAMATAPKCIRWILWSEVALQAAAAIHTGSFQRQKLVKV